MLMSSLIICLRPKWKKSSSNHISAQISRPASVDEEVDKREDQQQPVLYVSQREIKILAINKIFIYNNELTKTALIWSYNK